jgi:3-hydroxy-9,10-secoandrosta-1,3,5(10)-triene-9,17-dione monooxygenase
MRRRCRKRADSGFPRFDAPRRAATGNRQRRQQAKITTPTTSTSASLRQKLRNDARELVPVLRERAAECARLRRLPDATIADFQRAGFFRIMQPLRFGGFELEPQVFFEVQTILAEGCMSSAWVLGVVAIHNWQLGMFDTRAQRDVWEADNAALISSSYMPVGKVARVDGGFRISGHWGFSSGSKHCGWVFLGAMTPPAEAGGAADYRTFLVPAEDYQIRDNWNVSGLEGTGSHDIVVVDAFVPEYRTHRAQDGFAGTSSGCAANTNPIFRLPFGQVFVRAVSSSSIGALQGAVDCYLQANKNRVGRNDGNRAALDPIGQYAVAGALVVIDECKLVLSRNFERMLSAVCDGPPLSLDERIKMRFEAALVSEKCVHAMNALFYGCGAQGIFRDHPINRFWLDINAGRNHVANNAAKFGRNMGATLMGAENEDFFL